MLCGVMVCRSLNPKAGRSRKTQDYSNNIYLNNTMADVAAKLKWWGDSEGEQDIHSVCGWDIE